jgi:hypothetical protein
MKDCHIVYTLADAQSPPTAADIDTEPRLAKKRRLNVNFAEVEAPPRRFIKTSSLAYLDRTVLQRAKPKPCKWNNCDAMLASEWHLEKHIAVRKHVKEGLKDDVSLEVYGNSRTFID